LNEFCREWIRERYVERIRAILGRLLGSAVDVELHVADVQPPCPAVHAPSPRPAAGRGETLAPDPRYTFARFVTGPCNQLAAEAARAVASRLGDAAFPLYIYAPSGMGKTHLLSAIAHEAGLRHPGRRIIYLPTQRFVEQYVQALRSGGTDAFDRRYRDECDLLLLDDVHAFSGKDGSQERFFHVFNALHGRRAPIVLTSDQAPKEIPALEERLRTRFLWGLVVDIQPPEFETRLAILRRKADDEGIDLPDEVAHLVALHVTGCIRELEGVLGRIAAQARLLRCPLNADLARDVLARLAPTMVMGRTIDDVQRAVCDVYGVHLGDLRGHSRRHSVTLPRHVAMYIARENLRQAYPAIAEHFGNRDHTTVIAACEKVARLMHSDTATRNVVVNLRRQLRLA
jgi:chromosomal replication initiator protein